MREFWYGLAAATDSDEIVELLASVFSESEPPAVAADLTSLEMQQFLRMVTPAILSESLTIIARDRDSRELAGVLLTDDFARPPKFNPTQISPRFGAIFSMLEELDERYRGAQKLSPDEYIHLFMLAVDARFAGAGIAKSMVAACLENGIRRGYRVAVTEATGKISQHVFRSQGFRERFKVSYRDFRYEGKTAFAAITEHEGALLMEKSLV